MSNLMQVSPSGSYTDGTQFIVNFIIPEGIGEVLIYAYNREGGFLWSESFTKSGSVAFSIDTSALTDRDITILMDDDNGNNFAHIDVPYALKESEIARYMDTAAYLYFNNKFNSGLLYVYKNGSWEQVLTTVYTSLVEQQVIGRGVLGELILNGG
jgi:hypothetical protein